jgi:hypothetical protein
MNQKVVCFEVPANVATNATSAATIDTISEGKSFDFAHLIYVNVAGTNTSSTTKFSTFTVSHGTTTDASNHTTISGLQGTTNTTAAATEFVLPNPNSATLGSVTQCWVDLRGKERILRIVKQAPASHSTVAGIALLSRTADTPDTIADLQTTNSVTTATIGFG